MAGSWYAGSLDCGGETAPPWDDAEPEHVSHLRLLQLALGEESVPGGTGDLASLWLITHLLHHVQLHQL